ncbi:hypothetical protein V6N11_079790 [Hibiscus sabdariffa]|uniref:Uncharacterized protein n=1 Tax=Hibiscus sabdariffa TaxID=183260 RepID=A0ABR2RWK2_9ROSI
MVNDLQNLCCTFVRTLIKNSIWNFQPNKVDERDFFMGGDLYAIVLENNWTHLCDILPIDVMGKLNAIVFLDGDNDINRESSDAVKDHVQGIPNEETKTSMKRKAPCDLFSFQGLGVRKHGVGVIYNDIALHHQPIEYMTNFCVIPNFLMLRLVDGKERATAYKVIIVSRKRPYILVISIQIELAIAIKVVDKLMQEFPSTNLEDKVLFPGDGNVMNQELKKGYEILEESHLN